MGNTTIPKQVDTHEEFLWWHRMWLESGIWRRFSFKEFIEQSFEIYKRNV